MVVCGGVCRLSGGGMYVVVAVVSPSSKRMRRPSRPLFRGGGHFFADEEGFPHGAARGIIGLVVQRPSVVRSPIYQ